MMFRSSIGWLSIQQDALNFANNNLVLYTSCTIIIIMDYNAKFSTDLCIFSEDTLRRVKVFGRGLPGCVDVGQDGPQKMLSGEKQRQKKKKTFSDERVYVK